MGQDLFFKERFKLKTLEAILLIPKWGKKSQKSQKIRDEGGKSTNCISQTRKSVKEK